jgi:hypothetical protein
MRSNENVALMQFADFTKITSIIGNDNKKHLNSNQMSSEQQ